MSPTKLQTVYDLFNEGKLDKLVAAFVPDATYKQHNSERTAFGREQIAGMFTVWRDCFAGAHISRVVVRPAEELVGQVRGAAKCYEVIFVGEGRYVQTFPGLEGRAPATGKQVIVPFHELVWLGSSGEIIRAENTLDHTPLIG